MTDTDDSQTKSTKTKNRSLGTRLKENVTLMVSVVALVAYFVALFWLAVRADDAKAGVWERYVYLLTGVEAVVFAAVGWLFGKEVNRGKAELADDAVKSANDARKEAGRWKSKHRELASAVAAVTPSAPAALGIAPGDDAARALADLHQLALDELSAD